jgi:four helix bundle protein
VPSEADLLGERVKRFAVRILRFVRTLPRDPASDTVSRQLARAGAGMSSNYQALRRARSKAEFVSRLAVVFEEADESAHWLDVTRTSQITSGPELEWLCDESGELRALFSGSLATARLNQRRQL